MFNDKPHIAKEHGMWVLYTSKTKSKEVCARHSFWALCIEATCYNMARKTLRFVEATGVHYQGD